MDIGPIPASDSAFKRRARTLQAWYRVAVAKQDRCGPWRPGGAVVGSSLVDGQRTGANFLSGTAFAYAKERVGDKRTTPELTIDENRLFNNMLSSMPMCFNLFADLRRAAQNGYPEALKITCAMFAREDLAAIDQVTVELIPTPIESYTGDKTAFDAAIEARRADGKRCLLAVETKYTDILGANSASKPGRKPKLATEIFTADAVSFYAEKGFDQIARNVLLTYAYAEEQGFAAATNYVMALEDDEEAEAAVVEMQGRLKEEHAGLITWLPLQLAVDRVLGVAGPAFSMLFQRFRQRYLDFTQVAELLGHQDGTPPL